ncbi:hypothetical protein QR680_006297 [Steinernema hermaphroditum]|uniref:Uncharacterized protein n=1 Tax=Steinernema hermaphroditum TaxID=289476 RepID=A0AA39HUY3_9BILA|nr:hypothetical protein QR680_006297 [Steinernema hermaphroditum]
MANTWILWMSDSGGNETWEDSLRQLGVVRTVEEFDDLYNQHPKLSELIPGVDYQLFKDGLVPDWNRREQYGNGGRWILDERQRRGEMWTVDRMWYSVCRALIEGRFEAFNEHICGVYGKIRKNTSKVLMWTQNSDFEIENRAIGRILKSVVGCDHHEHIVYVRHFNRDGPEWPPKKLYRE